MERTDDKACAEKMKKLFIIFVCVFFLFASIAFAANETEENATAPDITLNCNRNSIPDPGETCLNCASDVRCKSGEMCTEAGECVKQANFTLYIIVAVGIFALLGLFFVAKRLTKKPEEPLKKPEFLQQKPPAFQQQVQKPIQPEPIRQQQAAQTEQVPQQVQMPPQKPAQPLQEEPAQKEEAKADENDEQKGETRIQGFIRQRRESGWTDEQIRKKMKESGWKDTQIALEFLKAPRQSARR